jgi:hypothetical protein
MTQGKSRMRQFRTSGSVRGVAREGDSYRDIPQIESGVRSSRQAVQSGMLEATRAKYGLVPSNDDFESRPFPVGENKNSTYVLFLDAVDLRFRRKFPADGRWQKF